MSDIAEQRDVAPEIRIWAPKGGNPTMEELEKFEGLEALVRKSGITSIDITPPLPLGDYHFDNDLQYLMFTKDKLTLNSPGVATIQQGLLDEKDLHGTFACFPTDAKRDAYVSRHGLELIHHLNPHEKGGLCP